MSGSIGGVDASIPLRAGQNVAQPANPLQMVGNYANIQGALLRNQLIPTEQQLLQAQAGQQQLDLARNKFAAGARFLLPLVGDPNPTIDKLTTGLAGAHAAGFDVDGITNLVQQGFPVNGSAAERQAWVRQNIGGPLMTTQETINNFVGVPTTRQTGLETQSGVQAGPLAPQGGSFTSSGIPTQQYPSRSERMAPVHWVDHDTGATVYGTAEEYARLTGSGHNLGPMEQGGPTEQGGAAFPKGFNGRPNVQPAQGGAQPPAQGQQAQAQPQQSAGPIQGPSPGMPELIAKNRAEYGKDQTEAGTFASRTLPLKQMIPLLEETATGPGSDTLNHVRSFLITANKNGVWPNALTPDAPAQAVYDELHKYMANAVTGMPFAAGSVPALAQAVSANPNTNLSTMANSDLAKVLLGLERYKQAQYLYFNQQHAANPNEAAGNYPAEKAQFATQYDPRAFAVDMMTPEARAKLYKSLSPAEQQKFRNSVKLAYSLPGLMN